MEEKKNPRVDLGNKRSLFMSIGICIFLGFLIVAFELKSEFEERMTSQKDCLTLIDSIPDCSLMIFEDTTHQSEEIIIITEKMPEPQGGMIAFWEYVGSELKYPNEEVEGRVFVQFIVEKDGQLADFKVIKGIGEKFDQEAIRVMESSPKWKPGMLGGKPAKIRMILPITFKLNP